MLLRFNITILALMFVGVALLGCSDNSQMDTAPVGTTMDEKECKDHRAIAKEQAKSQNMHRAIKSAGKIKCQAIRDDTWAWISNKLRSLARDEGCSNNFELSAVIIDNKIESSSVRREAWEHHKKDWRNFVSRYGDSSHC